MTNHPHRRSGLGRGVPAPDFTLRSTPDFRGQPVILVCGDQLALYNELLPEFRRFNADLIGISVDGIWCHLAFAKDRKYKFPLLADFEPKGAVARAYGAYRAEHGEAARALFVIDSDFFINGVRYQGSYDRGAFLRALENQ